MEDLEYIEAVKSNNQRAISRFYNDYRGDFFKNIGRYFHIADSEILSEIYQESVIRLWNNIQSGKLNKSNLTASLAGYLYCIGKNVALELFRRERIKNRSKRPIEEIEAEILKLNTQMAYPLWLETEQEVAVRKAVYAMGENHVLSSSCCFIGTSEDIGRTKRVA